MRISFSNVRCYHSPSLLGLSVSVTDSLCHHIQVATNWNPSIFSAQIFI